MTAATLQGPRYMRFLLFIAGMGGLLYGIDIGIIAGALPYLESTAVAAWKLSAQQLSFIVAAVLLGSVLSSLFAGALADAIGRKPAMLMAGALFTLSIPVIALADGYVPLLMGRLLQGISGGLIGVVVPLYLAECLSADRRGRGTAMFQLLLTIGLVVAALIGLVQARGVEAASAAAQAAGGDVQQALFVARDQAWRSIFWMSLAPGLVFTLGGLLLTESPRWLLRRGRSDAALAALRRSLPEPQANETLAAIAASSSASAATSTTEPLLSRRYVLPFLLACLVLACTQATGINSVLAYAVTILNAAGLPGSMANWADVAIKLLNAAVTVLAVSLVDRKGRKFLLMLGSGGIALSLLGAALLFRSAEGELHDMAPALAAHQQGDDLSLTLDAAQWRALGADPATGAQMLTVAWSYGEFSNVQTLRSDAGPTRLNIRRSDTVQPDNVIGALFRRLHLNPFADPAASAQAPLRIDSARLGPVPGAAHGIWTAACILAFVAFFAVGPGVCVWLALSELMPTRIRSNGMSIALLVNQFVSTSIAAVFLPTVGRHGYAAMFFFWAGCTLVFFLVAARLLPETKGRTLEEIEGFFAGRRG
ncbi:MFS transporter [Roseateles saccharophilus]|uniref:Sugar transport protein n=1 Tax=Roseateles saccharophilus TaxID=304 RepID=A0A4R3UH87_ROSSA|nr:MFS transporter [Roseateles saccharophilus]MDG0835244.1 MFS transporter [Roseateles saccharophilus]TCU86864.1 sugar transport protein [Roseateles saccharophilus]